jgi:hypothetical protein
VFFLKRSNKSLILSLLTFILGALGLIFLTAFPVISSYTDSDNWYRIFFNAKVKWRLVGITTVYSASNFPIAFTLLSLIGIIVIILGSIYWLFHTFAGKNNCALSNFRLPGPVTGVLLGLGGVIGFIGSMVFIPYGNDTTSGSQNYAIGYIVTTLILGLFILIGAYILFTSKKGKKSSKKKKRKR